MGNWDEFLALCVFSHKILLFHQEMYTSGLFVLLRVWLAYLPLVLCNRIEFVQGFRKVDPDRWEFANEGFLRGQKHLLKTIKRRKSPPNQPHHLQSVTPSLEIGRYALDGEVDRLKRDKSLLMAEAIKLRQHQENTRTLLQAMEDRLQRTEQKQQHIMSFLARAMQNPNFLQQLAQQKHHRKELEEVIAKKRRRPIDFRPDNVEVPFETGGHEVCEEELQLEGDQVQVQGHELQLKCVELQLEGEQVQVEGQELQDCYPFGGSEWESLGTEIQGLEKNGEGKDEHEEQKVNGDAELNYEFWEELLNEGIIEDKEDGDVKVLAERLESVSSSSPK